MIENEKMAIDSGVACDGRCEVRLLQTLQKAIGDILSEHARSIAGNARPPLEAPAVGEGREVAPTHERNMRSTNGSGLQTGTAGSFVAFPAQADAHVSAVVPPR